MCYNVKALLQSQLKRAQRQGRLEEAQEILHKLIEMEVPDLHQVSGFSHPQLLIYTEKDSLPVVATWGLVPNWVNNEDQKLKLWNTTLNARGETIFEKPAFRESAKWKRCLIYLDGFYEHHHFNGKTYPFFVQKKDAEPFAVAGLWAEWTDPKTHKRLITFSIVTTEGNKMMTKIHNNPKLEGPRMPVILPHELEDVWINPQKSQIELSQLMLPFPEDLLQSHTVSRISGKESKGNIPDADKEFSYEELRSDGILFSEFSE